VHFVTVLNLRQVFTILVHILFVLNKLILGLLLNYRRGARLHRSILFVDGSDPRRNVGIASTLYDVDKKLASSPESVGELGSG
jgi:hypothetical protein